MMDIFICIEKHILGSYLFSPYMHVWYQNFQDFTQNPYLYVSVPENALAKQPGPKNEIVFCDSEQGTRSRAIHISLPEV